METAVIRFKCPCSNYKDFEKIRNHPDGFNFVYNQTIHL